MLQLGGKERKQDIYVAKTIGWKKIERNSAGDFVGFSPISNREEIIPFYCSDKNEAYKLSKWVSKQYPEVTMSVQQMHDSFWCFWDIKRVKGKERRLDFSKDETLALVVSLSSVKVFLLLRKRFDSFMD